MTGYILGAFVLVMALAVFVGLAFTFADFLMWIGLA